MIFQIHPSFADVIMISPAEKPWRRYPNARSSFSFLLFTQQSLMSDHNNYLWTVIRSDTIPSRGTGHLYELSAQLHPIQESFYPLQTVHPPLCTTLALNTKFMEATYSDSDNTQHKCWSFRMVHWIQNVWKALTQIWTIHSINNGLNKYWFITH